MNLEQAVELASPIAAAKGFVLDPAVALENDQVFVLGYGPTQWVNGRDPGFMLVDDTILVVYKADGRVAFENDPITAPAHADLVDAA